MSSQRYHRQMILPDIGASGQSKLAAARVLIVGAGGLGGPVIQYLAAAGVGTIGICDFDDIAESNLHRQILFKEKDLGKNKAATAAEVVRQMNSLIKVEFFNLRLDSGNIAELFSNYEFIIDCSDNFTTKFLIHDACYFLKKNLIQASLYQYEGQIQNFFFSSTTSAPCLRCLWPRVPDQASIGNCQEAGVLGVVAGVLGTLQCNEVLKSILGHDSLPQGRTLTLNLKNLMQNNLAWKKHENCPLCGPVPLIRALQHSLPTNDFEIESFKDDDFYTTVDIRELSEVQDSPYQLHRPLSKIQDVENSEFKNNENTQYLFICQRGWRSSKLVKQLRERGQQNVFSLQGGIDAL